jgi:LPS-assembly protein
MLAAVPAAAANAQAQPQPSAAPASGPATATPVENVDFTADQVIYDSNTDVVTAIGEVRMQRDGN